MERIIPPLLAISLSTSRPLLLFSGVVESFMYLIILAMEDKGRQIIKSQGSFSPQAEYYFKDLFFYIYIALTGTTYQLPCVKEEKK